MRALKTTTHDEWFVLSINKFAIWGIETFGSWVHWRRSESKGNYQMKDLKICFDFKNHWKNRHLLLILVQKGCRWLGDVSSRIHASYQKSEVKNRRESYLQSRCFFFGPIISSVVALHTTLASPCPARAYLAAFNLSLRVWPPVHGPGSPPVFIVDYYKRKHYARQL